VVVAERRRALRNTRNTDAILKGEINRLWSDLPESGYLGPITVRFAFNILSISVEGIGGTIDVTLSDDDRGGKLDLVSRNVLKPALLMLVDQVVVQ
jgi:hypothetical protein